MLRVRSLIFDFLMYSTLLVQGILFAPLAIWSVSGTYWAMKAYCHTIFWYLKVVCNITVEFRGPVPSGEVVVCAKHMSFLDVMMLMHALPRTKFIMKRELIFAPVIGLYALRIGSAAVARGKKGSAVKKMVSDLDKGRKKDAGQTVIYPQGRRILPGEVMPYKVGAGVLYERFKLDCVPVATNTGVLWARRSPYRRPGVAVMEFLPTIKAGMKIKPFLAELEEVVESNSNRLMEEAGYVFEPIAKT
ncbi:MAG: 1-acyl-sn-glycerol-3-phosphate acyltransferase [Rhodobacteraceae bacterium]|nr:1-acyl-sn-glycerol-3-phosphate acyltransferase [Paracoccaceae bacterium]